MIETNSIFNLVSHAGIEGVASIISTSGSLEFFGVPLGTKALAPLVKPTSQRVVPIVADQRQPIAPLSRNLLMMKPKPVTDARRRASIDAIALSYRRRSRSMRRKMVR